MKNYRDLVVWQKSHELTLTIYQVTRSFPKEELYGLTSQIRRCCSSIPANIAEGSGRRGDSELKRFLLIASGSASELDYHLLLARDLGILEEAVYEKLIVRLGELRRRLSSLITKIDADVSMAKR